MCFFQLDIESDQNESVDGHSSAIIIDQDKLKEAIAAATAQKDDLPQYNIASEEAGTSTGCSTVHGSELLIRNMSKSLAQSNCELITATKSTDCGPAHEQGN